MYCTMSITYEYVPTYLYEHVLYGMYQPNSNINDIYNVSSNNEQL